MSQAILFVTQVILFISAGLLGFGVGCYLFVRTAGARMRDEERDVEDLRHALTDAQVRRARGS